MPVIEVKHLVKQFKTVKKEKGLKGSIKGLFKPEKKIVTAVNDISFSIEKGEIVGYIGPNGAGKSTTVKMMSGILAPTSGEILINGVSPAKDRKSVVRQLGVVFGQRTQLYWDLRLGESFELLRRIYAVDDATFNSNMKMMDDILGINSIIDTPVRQLSLGQRMRGDLAAAMLHSPDVLFLDEPTIGLDVDAKHAIRHFIKEINSTRKTTVILTTHDLGDIQELCKRLIIINNGVIIEDGSLDELVDRIAPFRQLIVDFYSPQHIEHPKAAIDKIEGARTVYRFEKSQITAAELIDDIGKQAKIKDIRLEEASIDDIIRIAYNEKSEHRA
ncbi:MAG: ATP-binding cassette domain-containing protein [Oscillospiraceae bacterium]|nr:ATP-binding cassette domain-containing protein [Oscillospiraceae bacterium]